MIKSKPPIDVNKSELPKNIPIYDGPLRKNDSIPYVKKASLCYDNQMRRCFNKNNPRYKDNGAKGISVLYSKRDFISWYIFNIKKYIGSNPSVGRIDHSKSYSFDNIRIESIQDNSIERISRCGPTRERRKIIIINVKTKEEIIAKSINDASIISGVHSSHISGYCKGKHGVSKNGYTFKYADEKESDLVIEFKKKERLKNPIIIYAAKTMEPIFIATSTKEIFNLTGIHKSHIKQYCDQKIKTSKNGYTLRYMENKIEY